MKYLLLCYLSLLFSACGTLDYETEPDDEIEEERVEKVVEKKTAEKKTAYWKERALLLKDDKARFGISEDSTLLLRDREGLLSLKGCDRDAVCLQAPYLGEKQLSELSESQRNWVSFSGEGKRRRYTFKEMKRLIIEVDLIDLSKDVVIHSCADETVLIASESMNFGSIDISTDGCLSRTKEGKLFVAVFEGKDFEILRNEEGRSSSLLEVKTSPRSDIHLCIDGAACGVELWAEDQSRDHKRTAEEIIEEARQIAAKNLNHVEFLGLWDRNEITNVFNEYAWCSFTSLREKGRSGLIESIKPHIRQLKHKDTLWELTGLQVVSGKEDFDLTIKPIGEKEKRGIGVDFEFHVSAAIWCASKNAEFVGSEVALEFNGPVKKRFELGKRYQSSWGQQQQLFGFYRKIKVFFARNNLKTR